MVDHLRDKGLGVDPVCRVLELSPSTYFARKKRLKSARRFRDEQLMPVIEEIHAESGGTYGACRITRALGREGVDVARCTVERLMAELDIEGVIRGQRRRTTVAEPSVPRPPDLVDRDFTASWPDQLWVADMTYVRTWSGWAYVAFVLDVYSRMIVGWQVANHMRTELPLEALEMALWRRRIEKDSGLIHHSDRGSQYVSIRYTDRLADIGSSASVGSVADSYDNAMAEALNGTFKAELIEMQGPGRTSIKSSGRSSNGSRGAMKSASTPRSTTYRPPSTNTTSGTARRESRSPPESIKNGLYETRGSSVLGCRDGVGGVSRVVAVR
ncbi:putative transposase [Streptomyces sp. NBRC 110611]|nr:putative transposase [Streptomyces sp. NBRC 110611]